MIDIKVRIEADKFNAAMRAMRKRLHDAVSLQQIIEYEVVKILEVTIRRTKMATRETIMATLSKPWRQYDLGNGLKKYYLLNHYPNELWAEITRRIEGSMERRIRAIGLARRSWLELGLRIAPAVRAPMQVRRAVSPRGHTGKENISVLQQKGGDKFGLTIENRSPLMAHAQGARALRSAILGRRRYFEQNLAHGVFDDLHKVAAKYPGLLVTVPAKPPETQLY